MPRLRVGRSRASAACRSFSAGVLSRRTSRGASELAKAVVRHERALERNRHLDVPAPPGRELVAARVRGWLGAGDRRLLARHQRESRRGAQPAGGEGCWISYRHLRRAECGFRPDSGSKRQTGLRPRLGRPRLRRDRLRDRRHHRADHQRSDRRGDAGRSASYHLHRELVVERPLRQPAQLPPHAALVSRLRSRPSARPVARLRRLDGRRAGRQAVRWVD